ncbi:hypothetical protein [Actinomadura sp. NTSP31]|uniref:hypothetical protein n=1 Tax=Actinomadura sp. NTSP31 TaxID=1735447 RepID=UPI0035BF9971
MGPRQPLQLFAAPPPTAGDEVGRTLVHSVVTVLMIRRLGVLWRLRIRRPRRRT